MSGSLDLKIVRIFTSDQQSPVLDMVPTSQVGTDHQNANSGSLGEICFMKKIQGHICFQIHHFINPKRQVFILYDALRKTKAMN